MFERIKGAIPIPHYGIDFVILPSSTAAIYPRLAHALILELNPYNTSTGNRCAAVLVIIIADMIHFMGI